jgi:MATE family multidrug resistance protein
MDVTDYALLSMLPTEDSQAAILPAQVMMWAYIVMGIGVVSMVNTFSAQCLGRGDKRQCSVFAWQSCYVALVFAIASAVLIPFVPQIVAAMGHAPSVQTAEIEYLRIAILTAGPTIIGSGLGWYFIGIHRPWITTWSALESIVLNAIVCYVLIFGYLGFPPMGIAGAAWGTVIATTFRAVRLALTMLLPSIHAEYGSRNSWRPSWDGMTKLLRYGLPFGLQFTSEIVVWAIFVNVLVGRVFGTADLIATNTAWQYLRIAFVPSMGVGQALTALVGKSIGVGDPQRAMREVRVAMIITTIYMGSLAVLYVVFGKQLIALFSDHPEVIGRGLSVVRRPRHYLHGRSARGGRYVHPFRFLYPEPVDPDRWRRVADGRALSATRQRRSVDCGGRAHYYHRRLPVVAVAQPGMDEDRHLRRCFEEKAG